MAQRITDIDLIGAERSLRRALKESGITADVTLHLGNSTHKLHNYLLIGRVNVWQDGLGGYTKRDAYRAMKLMTTALLYAAEAREDGGIKR